MKAVLVAAALAALVLATSAQLYDRKPIRLD